MQVTQLASSFVDERNLLRGIRSTFDDAEEAMLCVAFVSAAGVHLLRKALEPIRHRQGASLLVTTAFGTSTAEALHAAHGLGVQIRVMNPARGTYHPKLYVGRRDDEVTAIVGSANLTGGLISNVELATMLRGEMREPELATTLEWARDLWASSVAEPWEPSGTGPTPEPLSPELFALIDAAVANDAVFRTLGTGAANRVAEVTPGGLYVETERARARGRVELVPGWMIQLAWDYLQAHGALSNKFLLSDDGLSVKRSSFVCALLSRLPGVEATRAPIGVRLAAATPRPAPRGGPTRASRA